MRTKFNPLTPPLDNVPSEISDIPGLQDALNNKADTTDLSSYQPTSEKGQNNGYASLGADGKIPSSQVPAIAITAVYVVASEAAMLALEADTGDVAVRSDINKTFILQGTDPSTLSDWKEMLTPTDLVTSVDGQTGAVDLSAIYATIASIPIKTSGSAINTGTNDTDFATSKAIADSDLSFKSKTETLAGKTMTTPTLNTPLLTGSYFSKITHGVNNSLKLAAADNGAATGDAWLRWWISEPGVSWTGAKIARNMTNLAGIPRINTALSGGYIDFNENGEFYFVTETAAGVRNSPFQTSGSGIYVTGNMSALSITDRTKHYSGNALSELSKIKDDGKGGIDHATLPNFARVKVKRKEMVKEKGKNMATMVEIEEDGRDLGAMVSMLTVAVQQLSQELDELKRKIR